MARYDDDFWDRWDDGEYDYDDLENNLHHRHYENNDYDANYDHYYYDNNDDRDYDNYLDRDPGPACEDW